jgi:ankyrin repeat protein
MRHPIDRIASAYEFERRQGGSSFGAVLAKNTDLSGYIETRLALPNDRQCRNFHIHRLAMMFSPDHGNEFVRAKKALRTLDFVGVVEVFTTSIKILEAWLKKLGFKEIQLKAVRKNVSRENKKSLSQKLQEIEGQLDSQAYSLLIEANKGDLDLYESYLSEMGVE